MTKTLSNIIWKEFKVKTIFPNIEKCKCGNAGSLEDGRTPYVGATNRNNGTMRYVKASEKLVTKGNCIVFICDGQGSVGYSIYKAEDFVGSTTLKVGRNKFLNYYNAQFIIGALDKNRCIYSYGYKRTEPRLKNETIYLPVNSKGEPDYEFMENYIKEREEILKKQYKDYIKNNIEVIKESKLKVEWKEFFISEIFNNIQRGKRLIKEHQKEGNIPYVSSTALNNGVDNFISNESGIRKYNNCLSLANSGSVGACFYEPFEFIASDHVTHLKGNYSKYVYLFMSSILNRLSEKYNFNREINDIRIKREKIFLPVNSKGEPDYKYMEDYMKYLEQKKLLEYLEYIK